MNWLKQLVGISLYLLVYHSGENKLIMLTDQFEVYNNGEVLKVIANYPANNLPANTTKIY